MKIKDKLKEKSIKTNLLIVVIGFLVTLLITSVSYAAYVSLDVKKGVIVANGQEEKIPYSSNYLSNVSYQDDGNGNITSVIGNKYLSVSESGNDDELITFSITVCNYPQQDASVYAESNITYTMYASLVNLQNAPISSSSEIASDMTIKYEAETAQTFAACNNNFVASNKTLTGNQRSYHSYTITLKRKYINQVKVKMMAVPSAECLSTLSNNILTGYITFSVYAVEDVSGWSGDFSNEHIKTFPKEYAGFDYEITGSGESRVRLTWDTRYVELSEFSIRKNGFSSPTVNGDKKYVEFDVGTDGESSYVLQFYRTNGIGETEEYVDDYGVVRDSTDSENTQYVKLEIIG